jgi:serine/threonine-protein kinase
VIFLLFVYIPRAISQATAIARKRENEADALSASQPSESIILYDSALSLASDPEYEASLRDKLKKLDERLSKTTEHKHGVRAEPKSTVGMEQTIGLEAGDGRYCIQEELGRGAMGIVYRAHDRVLARDVALKQLPVYLRQNQQLVVRFQREAKALARLSHPHIVQVYDFVQDDEQAWIAMEFVKGLDLEQTLRETDGLAIDEAVRLGIQLAEALAYAHERGVIHRDFKPANVLLPKNGLAKITDFGLAKLAQSSVYTQEGSVLGSPAYMSPEQAAGEATDQRSDVYALGVTLYQMLTGRVPFAGDMKSVIAQKLAKDPAPLIQHNAHIPEKLDRLVLQMLAKEPDKRPASMDAVAEALKAFSCA